MFSIVIPNFNSEKYIASTINSVRNQTFTNWELIIIDDGSTDASASIINQFASKDCRIKLFKQDNLGVSTARNKGVSLSRNNFIAFLDSDDLWHKDKLLAAYLKIKEDDQIDFIYSRCQFISKEGKLGSQKSNKAVDIKRIDLLLEGNITTTTSSWIVSKASFEKIQGFNPNMSYAEDLDFLLRWRIQIDKKMIGINMCHTYYRTNLGGLSSKLEKMEDGWKLVEINLKTLIDKKNRHLIKYGRGCHYLYLARRALQCGFSNQTVLKFFTQSIISYPLILAKKPSSVIRLLILMICNQMYE
ncbi:glycosyltransferase [Synechococcus sp. N32]|uniref:glycosyltransferase family 2 protein n=1 Tax=Synechococcus sp. N32 TaxID=2575514 RepID=UPI000E0EEC00|nr:glycosyltransferase [Synechococcus sp. N32]